MLREVVEVCPHCEAENIIEWDIEKNGYVAKCTQCGKEMMLCDECMHSEDGDPCGAMCDWHRANGMSVCFRGCHPLYEM